MFSKLETSPREADPRRIRTMLLQTERNPVILRSRLLPKRNRLLLKSQSKLRRNLLRK